MDKPIFGDENRATRNILYGMAGLLGLFAVAAILIAIIMGFKGGWPLIFYAVLVVLTVVITGLLFQWYRRDGLDPKFKVVLILLFILVLAECVNILLFAFAVHDASYTCFKGDTEGGSSHYMMMGTNAKGKRVAMCFAAPQGGCLAGSDLSSGSCWMAGAGCQTETKDSNGTLSCSYTPPVPPPSAPPIVPPAPAPGVAPAVPTLPPPTSP